MTMPDGRITDDMTGLAITCAQAAAAAGRDRLERRGAVENRKKTMPDRRFTGDVTGPRSDLRPARAAAIRAGSERRAAIEIRG